MSLLDMVDKDTILDIQDSYMGYLESSGGIYDINGEYIALYAASGYCEFLNNASRKLCGDVENDKAAISSGKWICYKHCCTINLECIRSEKPEEYECPGGMLMYAVPIIADGMVIGSTASDHRSDIAKFGVDVLCRHAPGSLPVRRVESFPKNGWSTSTRSARTNLPDQGIDFLACLNYIRFRYLRVARAALQPRALGAWWCSEGFRPTGD